MCSSSLQLIEVNDIGQWLLKAVLSPLLGIGKTWAIFRPSGTHPEESDCWNSKKSTIAEMRLVNFKSLALMPFGPGLVLNGKRVNSAFYNIGGSNDWWKAKQNGWLRKGQGTINRIFICVNSGKVLINCSAHSSYVSTSPSAPNIDGTKRSSLELTTVQNFFGSVFNRFGRVQLQC